MNTIPIASRVGGIPEIVKSSFAEKMLFTPGDYNELVERIEGVLSLYPELLSDIGCKLREHVLKKFSIDAIKYQLLKVFNNA